MITSLLEVGPQCTVIKNHMLKMTHHSLPQTCLISRGCQTGIKLNCINNNIHLLFLPYGDTKQIVSLSQSRQKVRDCAYFSVTNKASRRGYSQIISLRMIRDNQNPGNKFMSWRSRPSWLLQLEQWPNPSRKVGWRMLLRRLLLQLDEIRGYDSDFLFLAMLTVWALVTKVIL